MNPPSKQTLNRYGLTLEEYNDMLVRQEYSCAICKKPPKLHKTTRRLLLVVDHVHQKGWSKMKPDDRKKYVRGLICPHCNLHIVNRNMTLDRARGAVEYLQAYEDKKTRKDK